MIENYSRDREKNSRRLFCKLLTEELSEKLGEIPQLEKIIAFFIRHNIVRQSIINRYVVIKLYPVLIVELEKKDRAVNELTKILPLEQTAIYNILSNHYTYFFPNKFDI